MKDKIDKMIDEAVKTHHRRSVIRENFKEIHQKLEKEGQLKSVSRPVVWLRPLAIAASVLLVISSFFIWQNYQDNQAGTLYATHFEPLPTTLVQGAKGELTLTNWMDAYESGDYPLVISLLSDCLSREQCNPFLGTYLAIAYLEEGQPSLALTALETVEKSGEISDMRKQVGRYYKVLTYLKLGDLSAARTLVPVVNLPEGSVLYNRLLALQEELLK